MQLTVRLPSDLTEALGKFREKLSKELGADVSLSKAAVAAIRRGLPSVDSSPPKPKRERHRIAPPSEENRK